MERLTCFLQNHSTSTIFAVVNPLIIPPIYHTVISQIILGLGVQATMFIFEFLRKKAKIKSRKSDYDQTLDDYLNDKNSTEIR